MTPLPHRHLPLVLLPASCCAACPSASAAAAQKLAQPQQPELTGGRLRARRLQVPFVEAGYLFLAATDTGATVLQENHAVQAALDAPVALCQPDELSRRFPWLNVEDVKLGSLGLLGLERAEGFLDPYLLTTALNKSARRQGVEQVCTLSSMLSLSSNRCRRMFWCWCRWWGRCRRW